MNPNRISIKEIAKKAGVHFSTVSRVLTENPKGKISDTTKQKILKIVQAQGFQKNLGMSRLKRGVKDVVLVTLAFGYDSLSKNGLYQAIHLRLHDLVHRGDARLVIHQCQSKNEDLCEHLDTSMYSHVIVLGSEPNASLQMLSEKMPVLRLFNRPERGSKSGVVTLEQDHEQAARLSLDFFLERKGKNVLAITSDLTPLHIKRFEITKKIFESETKTQLTPFVIQERSELQVMKNLKSLLVKADGVLALSFSPWVYLRLSELGFDFGGEKPFLGYDFIPSRAELMPGGHWLGLDKAHFDQEVDLFLSNHWPKSENVRLVKHVLSTDASLF